MQERLAEDHSHTGERSEILFVDDDALIVDSLSVALGDEFLIHAAESREQVKQLLNQLGRVPSLALIDLGLPPVPHSPGEGFRLIHELLVMNPNIKILVLSGQSDTANIQQALTMGAVDFIPKPCDVPLLKSRLHHQLMMLKAELDQGDNANEDEGFLGESQPVRTLHEIIRQFADTPFPVLVEGESGSGKELVAKSIHKLSNRSRAPLLTINCAAFSPELLEAQLFGHVRGAYTGATANRAGFFEEAGEGTLVLDEIGEMPIGLQSKLLRVLENGEYYRLGETRVRTSQARIIATTNRDLREETLSGRFRQDLYHRLGVLTIKVPPLRERGRDCLLLLEHFKKLYAVNNRHFMLEKQGEQRLMTYSFPGNVRELRNIAIRLNSKYPGKTVSVAGLEAELAANYPYPARNAEGGNVETIKSELLDNTFTLEQALNKREKSYITVALEMSGGNLSKAARQLGINRTTLYSRMQRLSIKTP